MDPTLQFLWNRRSAGRRLNEASEWAVALLEEGRESEAIRRLAGNGGLERESIDQLVKQILRDLRLSHLLDDVTQINAYEQASVADYYAGRIDGWTLIERGCDLYYESGEESTREFWIRIAADADQHGGQGLCADFPFHRRPFDEVLREALVACGFAPPGA